MKWLACLVMCLGFLVAPSLVQAQAVNPSSGSSNSQLQGAGAVLQQPGSGFQGTTPQNLTAPALSALNQNTRDVAGSVVRLKPSETSTTITPIKPDNSSRNLALVVAAMLAIAGFVLWQRNATIEAK